MLVFDYAGHIFFMLLSAFSVGDEQTPKEDDKPADGQTTGTCISVFLGGGLVSFPWTFFWKDIQNSVLMRMWRVQRVGGSGIDLQAADLFLQNFHICSVVSYSWRVKGHSSSRPPSVQNLRKGKFLCLKKTPLLLYISKLSGVPSKKVWCKAHCGDLQFYPLPFYFAE